METEEIISGLKAERDKGSIIMVAGVGGAGGNAAQNMFEMGIEGVEFMVCNTDQKALDKNPIETKIRLGEDGLGAGNDPEVGRSAAVASIDVIREKFTSSGTRMLFITAGMGGGTGTGASPVIAQLAKDMGILTIAIVTTPFKVEGRVRYDQAMEGIEELRKHVDSLLIINNDNIIKLHGNLSVLESFSKADDILSSAAKGIAEIITVNNAYVNVDFADVSKVMKGSGSAHMSVTSASGEDRSKRVAEQSLTSPLLDNNQISGAKNILVYFSIADEKKLLADELSYILEYIQAHACVQDASGKRSDANLIWGMGCKPSLGDALEVVVVATGFPPEKARKVGGGIFVPIEDTNKIPQVPPVAVEQPVLSRNETPSDMLFDDPIEINTPTKILGDRKSDYSTIYEILERPAYETHGVKFLTIEEFESEENKPTEVTANDHHVS